MSGWNRRVSSLDLINAGIIEETTIEKIELGIN